MSRFLRVMSFDEISETKFWRDVAQEKDEGFKSIDFAQTDEVSACIFWRTAAYILIRNGLPSNSTEGPTAGSIQTLQLIQGGKE